MEVAGRAQQAAYVRDRRPRRRRRRGRDRPPLRRARSRRPRNSPAGLAAFEDAPCFLEIVGEEAQRYREGGGDTARHVEADVAVDHEVRGRGHPQPRGCRGPSSSRNQAGIRRSRNVSTPGAISCTFVGVCQYGWITSSGVCELST